MTAVLFVLIVSSTASPVACNPFRQSLRLCHLPQGDGFRSGGKVSGIAQRRPLGGAGTPSGVTEGVKRRLTSSSAVAHTAPD